MTNKKLSTQAEVAKRIRKELKQAFPTVDFSVKSRCYAGGDSVDIEWQNGPTRRTVDNMTTKYEYGHFDGMQDVYEYTNVRLDIPQVKYVQLRREVTKEIKEKLFKELQKSHQHFDKLREINESSTVLLKQWGFWTANDFINTMLSDRDLTNEKLG